MISEPTARSRSIRETILRILANAYGANPTVCILADHLYRGFSASVLQFGRAEIDCELVDLIEDGLIAGQDAPGGVGPVAAKCYKTTSRGRDFFRAGCPWDKIDEFTGGQR